MNFDIVSLVGMLSFYWEFHGIIALYGFCASWAILHSHERPEWSHGAHWTNHRLVFDVLVLMILHHLVSIFPACLACCNSTDVFRNCHIQIFFLLLIGLSLYWLSLRIKINLLLRHLSRSWSVTRWIRRIQPSIIILEILLRTSTLYSSRSLVCRSVRTSNIRIDILRRTRFVNTILRVFNLMDILNFLINWISHDLIVIINAQVLDLLIFRIYWMRRSNSTLGGLLYDLLIINNLIGGVRHAENLSPHLSITRLLIILRRFRVVDITFHWRGLINLNLVIFWIVRFSKKIFPMLNREFSRISLLFHPGVMSATNYLISWRVLAGRISICLTLDLYEMWSLDEISSGMPFVNWLLSFIDLQISIWILCGHSTLIRGWSKLVHISIWAYPCWIWLIHVLLISLLVPLWTLICRFLSQEFLTSKPVTLDMLHSRRFLGLLLNWRYLNVDLRGLAI